MTHDWQFLEGSPYSVPSDDRTSERLRSLAPRLATLEDRCKAVRLAVAHQFPSSVKEASRTVEIFESNAIEGKTATLAETYEILQERRLFEADATLARYALHESLSEDPKIQDVVGLAAARILVDQYVREPDRPLAEADIRDMHELILSGHHSAGRYKQHLNRIEGSDHVPIPPVDVPGAMNQLVCWFRETDAPLVWKAAVAHAWFTHIHPFDDGNGRIARLMANYTLGFGAYPPLIVKATSDRGRYIDALGASDEAGDIVPLMKVFAVALDRQLRIMEKPDFGWNLFQKDLRVREDSLYRRWSVTFDRFFDEVAAHLRTSRKHLERVGWIGPSDFEFLRERNPAGNGWVARAWGSDRSQNILIWAGHVGRRVFDKLEADQVFPSVFLAERDPDPLATRPYRKTVRGLPSLFDELSLVADEERAVLRRGDEVRRIKLTDAAELWAELIARYLEQLESDELALDRVHLGS